MRSRKPITHSGTEGVLFYTFYLHSIIDWKFTLNIHAEEIALGQGQREIPTYIIGWCENIFVSCQQIYALHKRRLQIKYICCFFKKIFNNQKQKFCAHLEKFLKALFMRLQHNKPHKNAIPTPPPRVASLRHCSYTITLTHYLQATFKWNKTHNGLLQFYYKQHYDVIIWSSWKIDVEP